MGLHAAGILALPFLLLLAIETVARLSWGQTLQWMLLPATANPMRFTYLWLLAALVLLYAVVNRIRWAAWLLSGLTILAAILHAGKERLLQQPLVPGDFSLLAMTSGVWSTDYFPFSWRQVLLFMAGLLSGALYYRYGLPDWRLQVRNRLMTLLASGLCLVYFTANVALLAAREVPITGTLTTIWQPESNLSARDRPIPSIQNPDLSLSFNTSSFGLIPAFLLNTDKHLPEADEQLGRLSKEQIRDIWARQPPPEPPASAAAREADPPHVVVVLSESFWDPTWLDGVAISPDPLQNLRALAAGPGGCAVTTVSPIFGGYTCNAEFELLTGISLAALGKKAVPHRYGFRGEVPSLPAVFKRQGYRTVAIHPFLPDFWNRDVIYPQIGFDTFIHIDTIGHRQVKGKFISDEAVADEAIDLLGASAEPTFLFIVTMQNHSPYGDHRYGAVEQDTVRVLSDHVNADTVRDYVHGVRDADAMLRKLANHLAGSPRRALLVFVGDHQPNLIPVETAPGQFTQAIRADAVAAAWRDVGAKYLGPGLFWGNRGPAPRAPATTPLSLAALPAWILREANVPLSPFFRLSAQLFGNYPALCRKWGIRADGALQPLQELLKEERLHDYQCICHDLVFGAHHSQAIWNRDATAP
jgi:phosphoglycerol transferase MdoB-like AlkP superfamily enzyme